MIEAIFVAVALILIFIFLYRINNGENIYKYVVRQVSFLYDKYAPFSFKMIREKVKELGQEYTPKQYALQVAVFSLGAAIISYMLYYICNPCCGFNSSFILFKM